MTRCLFALGIVVFASAANVAAQSRQTPVTSRESYPVVSPRGFAMFSQQRFAAKQTFETIFGESVQPFRGGGADIVIARNFFAELGFSRFEQTGERAFRFGTETFKLGIPLTAKITPIEVSGGYRYIASRRVIPYAGVGFGSYKYEETSDFSTADENVNLKKSGFILLGGAEVRLIRWAGVSVDVRKTRINDVIGMGGLSKEFGETDLGGTSIRFRIMVGR